MIQHFYQHDIAIVTKSGLNEYGEEQYDNTLVTKARVQYKKRTIHDELGKDIQIDATCFIGDCTGFGNDDLLLTTDDVLRIKEVQPIYVGSGSVHHYELLLQKTVTDISLPSGFGGA